jgi:uncharacterized protein YjiK
VEILVRLFRYCWINSAIKGGGLRNMPSRLLIKGTIYILSFIILIAQTSTGHAAQEKYPGFTTAPHDVAPIRYDLIETYTVAVRDPSGLTYDPTTDSLWVVEDGGGGIYQIEKRGEGFSETIDFKSEDMEGIAYNPEADTFFIAEERKRVIFEVDKKGKILNTIEIDILYDEADVNHGFAGVTFNPESKHLFVVNEKNPVAVLEVTLDGEIVNSFEVNAENLSGICLDSRTGELLVLSPGSKMGMVFTKDGRLLRSVDVDIPRPEGIAIDNEGYIYVVCEETQQLYVYAPKSG